MEPSSFFPHDHQLFLVVLVHPVLVVFPEKLFETGGVHILPVTDTYIVLSAGMSLVSKSACYEEQTEGTYKAHSRRTSRDRSR